ncbi:hypothetical protein ABLT15_26765 [Paraburkholderia tropica]|uniref:hypothetical protein n=1 Tax=Paraburkholderia tropica TaxID=92647 RepID=UPI0032B31342
MSELEEMRKDARAFRRLMDIAGDDRGEYVRTIILDGHGRQWPRAFGPCPSGTYTGAVELRATFKWVDTGDCATFGEMLMKLREEKS